MAEDGPEADTDDRPVPTDAHYTRSQGDGGEPMEMKEWVTVFAKYGFAGLVAGFLLAVFVFDVRAAQGVQHEEHERLIRSVDAVVTISGQSDMAQQQILYVLQTMCVNGAKTESQRDDCQRRIDTRTR